MVIRGWLFALVFLASLEVFASKKVSPSEPSTELNTPWILRQISDQNLKSMEALLSKFQPKSLERHLLAYSSESKQFASFISPRVIVYSYDADFIMAYNGEPDSEGFYELEILRFDHAKSAFQPELITFDPKGINAPHYDPQPTNCIKCHQNDPRPNWDPYFHWVGFYGSEDDNTNSGDAGGRVKKSFELDQFAKFLEKKEGEKKKETGRYRFLPIHPNERPNLDFNDRVTCVSLKRMLRIFSDNELSGEIMPAIEFGSLKLDDLPPALYKKATVSFADIKKDTEKVIRTAIQRRIDRHILLTDGQPVGRVRELQKEILTKKIDFEITPAAEWRFIFEQLLKQPARPHSTSRHSDYSLNLGAQVDLGILLKGVSTDPKTKKMIRLTAPQSRPATPYGYVCPRSNSYFDLPIDRKMERYFPTEKENDGYFYSSGGLPLISVIKSIAD